jgi:mannose-6-phosphate isomerase-like protein (cupin superfamily)
MANYHKERVSRDFLEKGGWVPVEETDIPRKPDEWQGKEGEPGKNVLYRVREVTDNQSTCEVELGAGARSLVEFQTDSDITYSRIVREGTEEGIAAGDIPMGVIFIIDEDGIVLTPQSEMKEVKVPKKWRHQLINPIGQSLKLLQEYKPAWNSGTAKYQVDGKLICSNKIWFELRESVAQNEKGLKYRIAKFKRDKYAKVLTCIDPGVESLVEYHEKSRQVYTVIGGKGESIVDGKRKAHSFWSKRRIVIEPHQEFQFINKNNEKWKLKLISKPEWTPGDSFYIVKGKENPIPGADMWFAVHIV